MDFTAPPVGAVIPPPFLPIGSISSVRAHLFANNAWAKDLSGTWKFAYYPQVPRIAPKSSLATADIEVPSHFSLLRPGEWGSPIYTNVVYPIPVTAPDVPHDNPTGDHFTNFDIPKSVLEDVNRGGILELVLEGAESLAEIWINDIWLGTSQGSRLRLGFDLSDLVRSGKIKTDNNQIAVRVVQWSAGTYLEDQDQWWLPGLFREIRIEHLPANGLRDINIETDYGDDGSGILEVALWPVNPQKDAVVSLNIPGLDWSETFPLKDAVGEPTKIISRFSKVNSWSAEDPNLYDLFIYCGEQKITLKIGFRRIEIINGVLFANGRPLKLRGVNRHEIRAAAGRVFDENFARADLALMKAHNVNAIRTSHYPPHPRFLDLCDELGFWVMDECDLETHGYEILAWKGNPTEDPAWKAAILNRAERMVARDRNHACIFSWSLGNESHTGDNLAAAASLIRELDSTRLIHYEGDYRAEYTDIYSRMYPSLESVDAVLAAETGPIAEFFSPSAKVTDTEAATIRKMPYLLVEYLHAMGTGPGGVSDYAKRIWKYSRCIGGFVWEWRDHALENPNNSKKLCYGGDFGEVLHDGNFVCDGLVDAYSRPSSGLWEWAVNLAPVELRLTKEGILVYNRHHSKSLLGMKLRWRIGLGAAGDVVFSLTDIDLENYSYPNGRIFEIELGDIPPGDSWLLPLRIRKQPLLAAIVDSTIPGIEIPEDLPRAQGLAGKCFGPVGSKVLGGRILTIVSALDPGEYSNSEKILSSCDDSALAVPENLDNADKIKLDFSQIPALFRLGEGADALENLDLGLQLALDFSVWRAPTDNDNGHNALEYWEEIPSRDNMGSGKGSWCASAADRWRSAGLHRAIMRTLDVRFYSDTGDDFRIVRQLAVPGLGHGLSLDIRHCSLNSESYLDRSVLEMIPDFVERISILEVNTTAFGHWEPVIPRFGWAWQIPVPTEKIKFRGLGPGLSYPDLCSGVWFDDFTAPWWGMHEPLITPQEFSNRESMRALTLDVAGRPWGIIALDKVSFGLSPWSDDCLTKATHYQDLPPVGDSIWLHLDLGMNGLGSRSCGPDVRPEYQLRDLNRRCRLLIWS